MVEFIWSNAGKSVSLLRVQAEGTPPEEAFNPAVKRSGWQAPKDTGLWRIADGLEKKVHQPAGSSAHAGTPPG